MPQFGADQNFVSIPSWATGLGNKISWHPHPATLRADGRGYTIADELLRPWATRHYGRLQWGPNQPIAPDYELPNTRWFWFDLAYIGPQQLRGSTGPSDSRQLVDIDVTYLDTLFVAQSPGVQVVHYFFSEGLPIGSRITEYPNDSHPYQYNEPNPIPPQSGSQQYPASDELLEGDSLYRHFAHWPVSECWRWWNTHQVADCSLSIDGQLKPKIVQIRGFKPNEGMGVRDGSSFVTDGQQRFCDQVNQSHLVEPSWGGGRFGWLDCYLLKVGQPVWDPEAEPISPPFGTGVIYQYMIVAEAAFPGPGGTAPRIKARLHVRISRPNNFRLLEGHPAESFTRWWHLFGGIWGAVYGHNVAHFEVSGQVVGGTFVPGDYSDLDQYGFQFQPMPMAHALDFGFPYFDGGEVKFSEPDPALLAGLPEPGAVEQMINDMKWCLARELGTGLSCANTPPMRFGNDVEQVGSWFDPVQNDRLIVPEGVTLVRLFGHFRSTAGTAGGNMRFRLNGTDTQPIGSYLVDDPGGTQEFSGGIVLPRLEVSQGDYIQMLCFRYQRNFSTARHNNWVYVEELKPGNWRETTEIAKLADNLPAAGSEFTVFVAPESLATYKLSEAVLSIRDTPGTGDIAVDIRVIRASSRLDESLCSTFAIIEAGDYNNVSGTYPFTPHPTLSEIAAGDLVYARLTQTDASAKGLTLHTNWVESL